MASFGLNQLRRRAEVLLLCLAVTTVLVLVALFRFSPDSRGNQVLTVGLYENEPKIHRDEAGEPAGLFAGLLAQMAEREDWRLEWQDCEWQDCLALLEAGELDLMPDVAWSEARRERFDFHDIAVSQAWSQVYVHEIGQIPRSFEELDGSRIALLRGGIQAEALQDIMRERGLDFTVVELDSQEAVFASVSAGQADAAIANNFYGGRHAPRHGLVETAITFDQASLFFAAPLQQQTAVLDTIDRYLLEWRGNPDSYYHQALREAITMPRSQATVPWLGTALLVAGIVVPIMLGLILLLRWRVRQSTQQLRLANQRLEHVMDRSPVITYSLRGPDFALDWISPNVERILGFSTAQAAAPGWWVRQLHEEDRDDAIRRFSRIRESGHLRHEYRIRDAAGSVRYLRDELQLVSADDALGQEDEIVGSMTDMTDTYEQEQRLSYLANFDHLTGLPNHSHFMRQLATQIQDARTGGGRLCVLLVDLDRFSNVNESLGNLAGDSVLKEFADRLQSCLNTGDSIARFSADEFCLGLCLPRHGEDLLRERLEAMQLVLRRPVTLEEQPVVLTSSIGVCCFPQYGHNSEELVNMAEQAMFEAKRRGGDGYQQYHEQLQKNTFRRFQLENDLRLALENEELEVHFQPQVSMQHGGIMGVEALVRWPHPHMGMVPPSQFIPIAEDSSLIIALDEWVLRESCRQLRQWDEQGLEVPRISVNTTAAELDGRQLLGIIRSALEDHQLPPDRLELEITESMLMHAPGQAVMLLNMLAREGVGIAMDDFGTGYSNLAFLGSLPLDRIKLDRSFVRDIGVADRNESIIRTIFSLARALELSIVAEGVETAAQAEFLKDHGCDTGQGYFYLKPGSAADIEPFLRRYGRSGPQAARR